jgi:trimeric autotransporter adhesin
LTNLFNREGLKQIVETIEQRAKSLHGGSGGGSAIVSQSGLSHSGYSSGSMHNNNNYTNNIKCCLYKQPMAAFNNIFAHAAISSSSSSSSSSARAVATAAAALPLVKLNNYNSNILMINGAGVGDKWSAKNAAPINRTTANGLLLMTSPLLSSLSNPISATSSASSSSTSNSSSSSSCELLHNATTPVSTLTSSSASSATSSSSSINGSFSTSNSNLSNKSSPNSKLNIVHQATKAKLTSSNGINGVKPNKTSSHNFNKQQTKSIACKNGKYIDSSSAAASEPILNIIDEKKSNCENFGKLNIKLTTENDDNHTCVTAEGEYDNLTKGQSDSAIENDEYVCENGKEKKLKSNNKEDTSNDDTILNKANNNHKRISNSTTTSSTSSHYSSLFSR